MLLSFDVSVIDIGMLTAIIVLFALYATSRQKEAKPINFPGKANINKGGRRNMITQTKSSNDTKPREFQCPHRFGFLRTRKIKEIPEECADCEKRVSCMFSQD
jgi:hypothetical protein